MSDQRARFAVLDDRVAALEDHAVTMVKHKVPSMAGRILLTGQPSVETDEPPVEQKATPRTRRERRAMLAKAPRAVAMEVRARRDAARKEAREGRTAYLRAARAADAGE